MKNENGFSLLELAISMALYIIIGTVAYTTLTGQANQLIQRIEDAKASEIVIE